MKPSSNKTPAIGRLRRGDVVDANCEGIDRHWTVRAVVVERRDKAAGYLSPMVKLSEGWWTFEELCSLVQRRSMQLELFDE